MLTPRAKFCTSCQKAFDTGSGLDNFATSTLHSPCSPVSYVVGSGVVSNTDNIDHYIGTQEGLPKILVAGLLGCLVDNGVVDPPEPLARLDLLSFLGHYMT